MDSSDQESPAGSDGWQLIHGPLLNPRPDGGVDFLPQASILADERGVITYVGPSSGLVASPQTENVRRASGIMMPPFLDAHIHIPQHPIRGRFMEGVGADMPQGRLIAGLNRNVFPTEAKCSADEHTRAVVQGFLEDTLAKGVVGGAAYMTVHAQATRMALAMLPEMWSVGLVLMNMNCPEYLRTNEATLEEDIRALAKQFGRRLIVTDRFAVAVNTPLRTRAVKLAAELELRMQTHLNEQIGEKRFVEEVLYPTYRNYTDVYLRDGLLDHEAILAHCDRMSGEEFNVLAKKRSVIAHCPTSNTLLGSGVMPLDEVANRKIPYAICTDVGASPTTSILAEMAQYLKVHAGRSARATACEALFRSTLAPAQILGLDRCLGRLEVGKPMTLIEVASSAIAPNASAEDVIRRHLLELPDELMDSYADGEHSEAVKRLTLSGLGDGPDLDLLEAETRQTAHRLDGKVKRVVIGGREVFHA